jgi:hypothetical protein
MGAIDRMTSAKRVGRLSIGGVSWQAHAKLSRYPLRHQLQPPLYPAAKWPKPNLVNASDTEGPHASPRATVQCRCCRRSGRSGSRRRPTAPGSSRRAATKAETSTTRTSLSGPLTRLGLLTCPVSLTPDAYVMREYARALPAQRHALDVLGPARNTHRYTKSGQSIAPSSTKQASQDDASAPYS